MRRILVGKTINSIGLGCMGMSEFYGSTDDKESMGVLALAFEKGVEHFDTADAYGYGHNEIILGKFLRSLGKERANLVVATKCGIVRDENPENRGINNSPDYILKSWQQSSERLDTSIDLFYLHRLENGGASIDESMSAMADLLLAEKIKGVGLSEASADIIIKADKSLRKYTNGDFGLEAIQTEYSIMSTFVERNGVLQTTQQLGINFVAYSPIGRGVLTGKIQASDDIPSDDFRASLPRFSKQHFGNNLNRVHQICELAESLHITPAQLSLAWLINSSKNLFAIPGTKRQAYLKENIEAEHINLTDVDMDAINNIINENPVSGLRYSKAAMDVYGLQE